MLKMDNLLISLNLTLSVFFLEFLSRLEKNYMISEELIPPFRYLNQLIEHV